LTVNVSFTLRQNHIELRPTDMDGNRSARELPAAPCFAGICFRAWMAPPAAVAAVGAEQPPSREENFRARGA
jgi:hypothetical protein